jgi:hypothetical protein
MLDNFLEHLRTGTRYCWRWMKRTVSPSGGTISARNMPPSASCVSAAELPFMALTATADDTTRLDIVRLLGLNDR